MIASFLSREWCLLTPPAVAVAERSAGRGVHGSMVQVVDFPSCRSCRVVNPQPSSAILGTIQNGVMDRRCYLLRNGPIITDEQYRGHKYFPKAVGSPADVGQSAHGDSSGPAPSVKENGNRAVAGPVGRSVRRRGAMGDGAPGE